MSSSSSVGYLKSAGDLRSQPVEIPSYCSGNNTRGSEKKGSVTLDNATYKDKISDKEFLELLMVILDSRVLLSSSNLTKGQTKHKRILLALLVSLNWGVSDPFTQARLIKAIEDRIDQTNILKK